MLYASNLQIPFLFRFGCAHLLATNLCLWLNILAKESLVEIQHAIHQEDSSHTGSQPHDTEGSELHPEEHNEDHHKEHITKHTTLSSYIYSGHALSCDAYNFEILGVNVEKITIYLYPLAIEFTLIGAILFYEMYHNIGHK